jgi:DnaJ-class molecular chaperone
MNKYPDITFYQTLNVSPTATNDEIKKAFRRLAMKWHPDKWSNATDEKKKTAENEFKKLTAAYEVLSDPEKRQQYDMYGKDAVNGMGGRQMNEDMVREMFENMGGGFPFMQGFGGRQTKEKELKLSNIEKQIELNLKEIYMGATIEFEVTRYNLIKNKQPSKHDMMCGECKGKGSIMRVVQMGPGMMSQTQQRCSKCYGQGINFPDAFFEKKTQKFTKTIPKGIIQGQQISIENKGHEIPKCFKDQFPGQDRTDIILIAKEERVYEVDGHRYIRGINSNPFNVKLDITIEPHEAICGTFKYIPFINGDYVSIRIPPGIIFKRGDNAIIIPKMGMPYYKQKNSYGDLFVMLDINDNFNPDTPVLKKIWKLMTGNNMDEDNEKVLKKTSDKFIESMDLNQYNESDAYKASEMNRQEFDRNMSEMDDDDDAGPGTGGPAGCAQQ